MITKDAYPKLFEAIELVYHDNGMHRFLKESYETPFTADQLTAAEGGLARLDQNTLEEFAIGDVDEAKQLALDIPELAIASAVLERIFNQL